MDKRTQETLKRHAEADQAIIEAEFKKINEADEIGILEFDFEPLELIVKNLITAAEERDALSKDLDMVLDMLDDGVRAYAIERLLSKSNQENG